MIKKLLFLMISPFFTFASQNLNYIFSSSCEGVNYKIQSSCELNSLRKDQDKLDIPICDYQTLIISGKNIELTNLSEKVTRIEKTMEKKL